MDWVAEGIAIGGKRDTTAPAALAAAGVEAVLQLHGPEPCDDAFPFTPRVLQLRVLDGVPLPEEVVRESVTFIREQRSAGRRILVACGAGQSRSASLVAAYLCEEGLTLEAAFTLLIEGRPRVLPHPALLRSLCKLYPQQEPPEVILGRIVRFRSGRRHQGG